MKNEFYGFWKKVAFAFLLTALSASPAFAATFNSGSTGALGNVVISANTQIPLPANGMLNYSSLTINSGATLTFTNNSNNTPVYILATGVVTINGTINVSGGSTSGMTGGTPGPGGWAGGNAAQMGKDGEPGRGPGGGGGGRELNQIPGGGGGFGTSGGTFNGVAGGNTYGSDNHMPLLGGSGGGGYGSYNGTGSGGGGGGGAILIAASGTITINGTIYANGGYANPGGGGGSGGAIHLLATAITGNGILQAAGGGSCWGPAGGNGRIRLEAYNYARSSSAPSSPASVITFTPYWMFPGNNPNEANPTLTIVSVNGVTPNFSHFNGDPDILFSASTSPTVTVVVQATGIPDGTNITVTAKPNSGGSSYTSATAALASGTATVQLTLNTGSKSILGVSTASYTLTSSNGAPLYVQGEKVKKMKVAANMDGSSTVTYITESGKEITKVM